jgi:cytochrome b561
MTWKGSYPPALIVLHWLTALLLVTTFSIGIFVLVPLPNTAAEILPLGVHMLLGAALLGITVARYLIRRLTIKPSRRVTAARLKPKPFLVQSARPVQQLLYLFTFLMALSGIGLALQAGLLADYFSRTAFSLPADFYIFPLRRVHGVISFILVVLVFLHLMTWVYHQFVRGENALAWIWFTKKREPKHE